MRRLAIAIIPLGLAMSQLACGVSAREARATQPNPARLPRTAEELPASVRLYIHQRDMHLPRDYQLRSFAQFVVVSKELVRFHIGVVRYDEGEADTRGWKVFLEDETGKRLEPESRDSGRIARITVAWALWPYHPGDSWCQKPPCLSRIVPGYEVYEGMADYLFREPGILGLDRKLLRLVVRRGGVEYRYAWRFGDEVVVEHYGRSKVDNELGTIVVPGPNTEVAGVTYETERP